MAYGGAEAGRDYKSVDVSERMLRDVNLPPFKSAFEADALTLKTILRDEWGWSGVVVSDYARSTS